MTRPVTIRQAGPYRLYQRRGDYYLSALSDGRFRRLKLDSRKDGFPEVIDFLKTCKDGEVCNFVDFAILRAKLHGDPAYYEITI